MPVLESLAADLWSLPMSLKRMGIEIGTRMTIVRLPGGRLFVHSPVHLTPALKAEVDALGPVAYLVAPNRDHHFYLSEWKQAYPEARLFGVPGLPEKRTDLQFDGVLGDQPESEWAAVLDQALVHGIPYFNEVVFFHNPTRTLILTDLALNFGEDSPLLTRLVTRATGSYGKFGWGRPALGFVKDKEALRRSLERLMEWDFDRILLTHGRIVESGGRSLMRDSFDWVLDRATGRSGLRQELVKP